MVPWDHWTSYPSPVQLRFLTFITANARNLWDGVQARNGIEINLCGFFFFLIKYKSIILIYLRIQTPEFISLSFPSRP